MNLFAESFVRWLADYYLLSTLLLVVTLAVNWFVAQPARRVAITRATLAGLALLAALCALPGWSVLHLITHEADVVPTTIASAPITKEDYVVEAIPVVAPMEPTPLPAMPEVASVPPTTTSEATLVTQVSAVDVVSFAFLTGTIVVLAWQLIGHWRARVLLNGARNASTELQEMLNELAEDQPRLLISPRLPTAVALGVIRPTILLPQKLVETSDLSSLRTILAHELAHIRHGDLRLLAVCRALFVLFWANPLFWLLRRRLRLDQETLADAAAAEVSTRHRYAEQLVEWAKRFATDRPPALAAAVGLWESPSQLRLRIAVLLDERLTIWRECSRRWRLASLAVCAGVAVGLSLVTLEPGLAEPEKNEEKPIAAVPEAEVEEGAKEYLAPIFISGRTLDQEGNRVAGATVYLASQDPGYKRLAETKSDERGYYEFKDIKLPIARADTNQGRDYGGFEVFGTADGYGLAWREKKSFYPNLLHNLNEPGDPTRERPTAYGAADPIVLDLTFGPPATFRGRVVDENGQPIPNTVLDIRYADFEWDREDYSSISYRGALSSLNEREIVPRNLKTRRTDADGRFEFTGLPFDHRFSIWIHPPGFPTKRIWVVSNDTIDPKAKGDRVYNSTREIVLEQATPRNVPIQVVYGDTGEPAPKVFVSAGGASATTNIEGRARLRIPDGDYTLHLLQRIGTPYRATETSLTVSEESVQEPARAELEPAAVLIVTVVDAQTGIPLTGVDIWREEPNVGGARPYRPVHGYRSWEVETRISHYEQPRTGNDGKARVLFAPGTHRIGIAKESYPPGYTPVERDGVELELEAGEPVEVEFEMRRVGASQNNSGDDETIVFVDTPANNANDESPPDVVPAPTELSGVVHDNDGKPLAGVTVDAWTWYPGNETTTDESGRFTLKGFDAHEAVEVEFRKDRFGPRHFANVAAGIKNWSVRMDNRTYLEGRMTDSQGEPVADAVIRAERGPFRNEQVSIGEVPTETRTKPDGQYRLYLEPDTYDIKIRVPGRGVGRYEGISIASDQQKPFDIQLEPGVTFRAKVINSETGEPVEGITLWNWRLKGIEGTSNAGGLIEIPAMFPGKLEFNVTAVGVDRYRSRGVAGNFARWWSEEAVQEHQRAEELDRNNFQRNFDDLEFDVGADSKAVTIYVEPCVTITGRVTDPEGQPVAGATVAPAKTGSGNSLTGDTRFSYETREDGTFEVKLPPSGAVEFNLIAHDGKYGEWRKWANATGEPQITTPGERIDEVELHLSKAATVRGKVVNADGEPVAGKKVRAADFLKRDNRYYHPTTKSDNQGNFELKFIAPGKHFIQTEPFWLDADQAPGGTVVVELKAGEVVENVVLESVEEARRGLILPLGVPEVPAEPELKEQENSNDQANTNLRNQGRKTFDDYFILCPVTTDLQRSLLGEVSQPATDASLCVFVNGEAFGDEQISADASEFVELADRLEEFAEQDKRQVIFRVLFAPTAETPFNEFITRADSLSDLCATLSRVAGFERSTWSSEFSVKFNWDEFSKNARTAADQAKSNEEIAVGDGRVQVFPVRNYLSRLLVNADCVVNIVPVVGQKEGNRFPNDFVAEMKRIVPQLEYNDQKELLVRVRIAESAKEQLERWVNDIEGRKAFAKEFGFENCNLSQSFTNEAEAAPKEIFSDAELTAKLVEAMQLIRSDKPETAIELLEVLMDNRVRVPTILMLRAEAWERMGEHRKALDDYKQVINLKEPVRETMVAYNNAAYLLATCEAEELRDGKRAIEFAKQAIRLAKQPIADSFDTLAAAYAEAGEFEKAIEAQEEAITLDPGNEKYREILKLYEEGKPRRGPSPAPTQ